MLQSDVITTKLHNLQTQIAWRGVLSAIGLVATATTVFLLLSRYVDLHHDVDLLYLPIVLSCAARYGIRSALMATALSVICWDFFFLEPLYSLHIGSPHDLLMLTAFLLVSLFTTRLSDRVKETTRQAAILDERNRMAREIHDTLAQGLTGIVIQLQVAERVNGLDLDNEGSAIRQARLLAQECLEEARRSVKALRPRPLEQRTLSEALGTLILEMTRGLELKTDLHVVGSAASLDEIVEINLLRIGQEGLTNALRHAGASRIDITLTYNRKTVSLAIQDDGAGFETDRAVVGDGMETYGLAGMRERAEAINGSLTVKSRPEQGTRLEVVAPISRRNLVK